MTRSSSSLTSEQQSNFQQSTHLFATNEMVMLHNKQMLISSTMPVALCIAEQLRGSTISDNVDEQLESKILLCIRQ